MPDIPTPYRRTLLLDESGDIFFDGSGKLTMTTTDVHKREQDISIYIKTVLGEDMFNTAFGFDIMAAKTAPFSKERIEYEIRNVIEQYRNRVDRPHRIKSVNAIIVSDPDVDRRVAVGISMTADTNTISTLGVNI